MKTGIRKFTFILILAFSFLPAYVFGQDPNCDPDDPACPIDDGVIVLIVGAVGLAAKKCYDSRKKHISVGLP